MAETTEMDPESPPSAEEAAPLKTNSVLMRRSTRVFKDRQPSEGVTGKAAALCCSLLFSLILLALFNALSIACIVIGIVYLDKENCPAQVNIAPVLIASGVLAVILSVFEGRSRFQVAKDGESTEVKRDCCYWLLYFARLVKTICFIYLCVIVFHLYSYVTYDPYTPTDDEHSSYCNQTLFLFTFWTIVTLFVIAGIMLFFFCCCCCCLFIKATQSN